MIQLLIRVPTYRMQNHVNVTWTFIFCQLFSRKSEMTNLLKCHILNSFRGQLFDIQNYFSSETMLMQIIS